MKRIDGFYTMKGYSLHESGLMTNAMEDYLEMISRLSRHGERVRVNDLAKALHVKASSVTKMARHLTQTGYVQTERYGRIGLTAEGEKYGQYLLYRHEVLQRFLCYVNHTHDELAQVEKIEHFLNQQTIANIALLLDSLTGERQRRDD